MLRSCAVAFLLVGVAGAADAARVESFSPEGTARGVRQVAARFSEAMVPLGDPRSAADPFRFACEAKGAARWADGRSWIYSFDEDLPAGLRCSFELRPGLRSLAGAALTGQQRFSFSTGGPAVLALEPDEGLVAEDQRFALRLDGELDRASFERHAYVRSAGLPDPIGLRIVEGPEREAVLATEDWKADDPRILVVEARQRFAPGAKLVLHWGAGIAAPSGVASEEEQAFDFEVRPRFAARFACERTSAEADCVPLSPIRLVFSSPVAWQEASRIVLREQRAAGAPEPARSWPAQRRYAGDGDPYVDSVEFRAPFPPEGRFLAELPPGFADDAGRALALGEPLEVRSDGYPALAKFAAAFGVVEAAHPVLPVTVRRLEAGAALRTQAVAGALAVRHATVTPTEPRAILHWLHAVGRGDTARSVFAAPELPAAPTELVLPRAAGEAETEVIGLPLGGPGLHVVEIESRVLGEAILDPPGPMYVAAGALVTNLAVHFKWGNEGSLVWVTSLDRGEPVAGARVRVADCRGEVLADGTTDATGVARVAGLPHAGGEISEGCGGERGWSSYSSGLLVLAELGDDLGLGHTSWSDGIEPWRFGVTTDWRPRALRATTLFDRTLLRAGDTLHMKHVLRRPVQAGFAAVPPGERPKTLRIVHLGGDEKWDLPLEFAADGSALSEWTLPRQAKLGSYEVSLLPPSGNEWEAETTGSFRVEAFRVPLARAVIQPPADALVAPRSFPVDLAVQYLAGGGASALPVVLRSQPRRRGAPSFPAWSGFEFGAGGVREGVRARRFGEAETEASFEAASQELVLDAAGTGRAVVAAPPDTDRPLEVLVELEFRDPNGEVQTSARAIPLWPSSRLVGLRSASVRRPEDGLSLEAAVVDLEGAPLWLAAVEIDAYERRSYAARKRVVGGFYAYEDVEEVVPLGRFCAGRTDRRGRFACEGPAPAQGDLVFVARSSDWSGRASVTQTGVWVPGDDGWFAQGDGDRMDLVPEKPRYEPGETARFQVRMPFREATALVSVEREGVAETSVVHLSGRSPSLEVPILPGHAPNVFVSVLAVRGRAGAPAPTASVDLAKPSYRLGIAEIEVGWRASELAVRVVPERASYRVRETAAVHISVRDTAGAAPPPGSEIALAAVDEGLLELMPNRSWRLLEAMMGKRAYGVRTSTAQLQVVGKRHYGRKALPAGGGGGQRATRELFDTLLLWRGRVALDGNGEARVEIPLNDSLTSFRIAALATGGEGLFGSGEATIRTTQDLMILAGLPPVVREGDQFAAGFTIRNTTEVRKELSVAARAEGLGAPLETQHLLLEPGESRELSWPVVVPAGVAALPFEVELAAAGGAGGDRLNVAGDRLRVAGDRLRVAGDRLRVATRVVPAVPERVLQATLVQVRGAAEVAVEAPADALPGRGGLEVALRPRLAGSRDAILRAMGAYPYTCLEQQVSTAVALGDASRWAAAMEGLPGYLDGEGLARFFPGSGPGSEVLTAYLVALADEAGLELPAAARERMLAGLASFASGSLARREAVRAADLPLRKLAAAEALARHGKATPELVGAIPVEPALLTNAGLLDWLSLLERVPELPRRAARLAEAERLLRARLDVQGTSLGFASADGTDWLLAGPDVSAARLVLSRLGAPGWREELPRLARGALALQRGGAWATTTGNAWGVLALEGFSKAYETADVTGHSEAAVGAARESVAWATAPEGGALHLPWPPARAPLALRHTGSGAPWALVQSIAAVPLREPFASGYRIERSIVPVKQRTPGAWSRGDVARVRVEVEADADASWVVASDPIPAGASILGSGLGGDSQLLAAGERGAGGAWEAYTERSEEAFRRYYELVPKGRFAFEYSVRFNQAGRFSLPPTRVEAMYSPERLGELPNQALEVQP